MPVNLVKRCPSTFAGLRCERSIGHLGDHLGRRQCRASFAGVRCDQRIGHDGDHTVTRYRPTIKKWHTAVLPVNQ